jgi:uroporphyrinogen III methyltransferase/synthase
VTGGLSGKRVAVTRSAEGAEEFAAILRRYGAEPLAIPTVSFSPPPDWAPADRAVADLASYGLLVFTSRNAVFAFLDRVKGPLPAGLRIAAIGAQTARALDERGLRADLVPGKPGAAEELIEAIAAAFPLARARVLVPRALEAREILPEALSLAGAKVDVVPVYRTVPSTEGRAAWERILDGERIDWVTFGSGSAVHAFFLMGGLERTRDFLKRGGAKTAVIGRVTEGALLEYEVASTVTAASPGFGALAQAMDRHEREARDGS